MAQGPRTGLAPPPPTAREAQVWEAETRRSPPTQFHFLFVPSFPSHGVLFEASPRCGRVRSRPRAARGARCVPLGVAPWRASQSRRSGFQRARPLRRPRPGAPSWAPGAASDSGPPPRGHAEQLPGPRADPPRDPRAWKNRSGQRGWSVPAPSGATAPHKRRRHAGCRRTECSWATRAGSQEGAELWLRSFGLRRTSVCRRAWSSGS